MNPQIETLAEPQAAVKTPPSPVASPAPGVPNSPWLDWRGSGSVLVVDDEDAIRLVVSRAVAKMGFTANLASNGAQAVSLFKAEPSSYSIVLLDLKIPGTDSAEVMGTLRQLRPDIPVLLMSGCGSQDALARLAGLGVSGFLQKPFTLEELALRMRSALQA